MIFGLSNQKEGPATYWVGIEQVEHICEERKGIQCATQKIQNDTRRKGLVGGKEIQEHGLPRIQKKVCQGGQSDKLY